MTTLPVTEAKARLNELTRLAHTQHERFTLTRNGTPEAVLLSVDDLEGLETTLEVLADGESVARIAESLAQLDLGETGMEITAVREELTRRRAAK